MIDANVPKIVQHQLRIQELIEDLGRDLTRDEWQDQVNKINADLDPRLGIVAGDGCYYPRRGFPLGE